MTGSILRRRSPVPVRLAGLIPAFVLLAATAWVATPAAHEIPASISVQTFIRPEARRLLLLVRLPLVSMRDYTFPTVDKDALVLDVTRVGSQLPEAAKTWILPAFAILEDGRRLDPPVILATRVSLPSDRSFASFDEAVASFGRPPLTADDAMPIGQALFDVMLEYRIESDRARFSVDPQVARFGLAVTTTMRFQMPGEAERAFQFHGDPGVVYLDPRWHQAAWRFVRDGFRHILDGIDHLLFLFCLVLPLRRIGQLIIVVTAFTVAHSITLFCAAFGLAPDALWFPPLIETLIAASIVYMALENIVVAVRAGKADVAAAAPSLQRRWLIAFAFGLVHGFGFSFVLQETLQFAGSHLVTSLVAFNVGVEFGQVLVLLVAVPVLALVFRHIVEARIGIILASALVAHTAWHWMTERGAALGEYDWSLTDPATLATLLRMLMVVVALAGAGWLISTRRRDAARKK